MELPEDIVILIREFSRPMTRSDWKMLHIMTNKKFHVAVMKRFNRPFYDLVL